jgi:hypothetical protein
MEASMKLKFKWWYGALALSFILAILSPLASSSPDGLERVAADRGFVNAALKPLFNIMPEYTIPGVSNSVVAIILAGLLGTLVLFIIGFGLAKLLRSKDEA